MLTYVFDKVLFLSLAGSIAILAAWLLCRVAGRRLTCRWRYYIWLLPVALLLLPITTPAFGGAPAPVPAVGALPAPDKQDGAGSAQPAAEPEKEIQVGTAWTHPGGTAQSAATPLLRRKGPAFPVLPALWLAGMGALALLHGIEGARFRRFARRCADGAEDWEAALLQELRTSLKVRGRVELRRFHGRGSPFLCGVLRPVIYLPEADLSPAELRRVLAHELTHCRRRDLAVKRLVRAVRVLHWYNPLVWLLERQTGVWCELSCDEAVVARLARGERQAYGLTILKLMRTERGGAPVSAYLAEREIKNRLEVIMGAGRPGGARKALAAALTLALCLGCAVLAAGVGAQNPNRDNGLVHTTTEFTSVWCRRDNLQPNMPNPSLEWMTYIPGTGMACTATGSARLVNLPGSKSFSADLRVENLRDVLYSREYFSGPTCFRVEMTSLTGVSEAAGSWSGLFTVEQDGAVIFENAPGTLTGTPSLGSGRSIVGLTVYESDGGRFSLHMNFGVRGDEAARIVLERQAAEESVQYAADARGYYLTHGAGTVNGFAVEENSDEGHYPSLYVSENMGGALLSARFDVTRTPPGENGVVRSLSLVLEPWDVTGLGDGVVRGVFQVGNSTRAYVGEFDGVLSGLDGEEGDELVLRSDDGMTDLRFRIVKPRAPLDPLANRTRMGFSPFKLPEPDYRNWAHAGLTGLGEGPEDLPFALGWDTDGLTLRWDGGVDWRWTAELYNEAGDQWYVWGTDEYAAEHEGYPMFQGAYRCRRTETDAVDSTVTLPFPDGRPDRYVLYLGAWSNTAGAAVRYYEVELRTTASGVLVGGYDLYLAIENPDVPADMAMAFMETALPRWVLAPQA